MNVIAVYPGRFHPFHRGHASSFKQLKDQFGLENTYLAISAKQELPKSPFSAGDRAKMAMALGIPKENIILVKNPYSAEEYIVRAEQLGLDPNDTALVFGVSKKDMEGDPSLGIPPDPRFTFKSKRDGSPSYFQPLSKGLHSPMTQHGYVKSTDVAEFPIAGKMMRDASEIRSAYMKGDEKIRNQILIDLYGSKAAALIKPIFDANLQLTENFYRKLVELKKKITESRLNELDRGEGGFGPFKLYAGDAHKYHHVDTFKSLDAAIAEVEFLIDSSPELITTYWKIVDGTGEQVWDQDPDSMYDKMRSAGKMQFKKPGNKDVTESSRQQINDYDTWSDQVAAQGGEVHPQKDRVRMVAQSWSGDTMGEFNLRTGQGWINGQQGVTEDASEIKKKISKYEELALAANRAGDDTKCKLYQQKIQSLKQKMSQGMAEATGDPKFDKMLKGITGKRQVAKQQKADTKQQARDAFGGMFGGGNPADKLSIRKKGVAEVNGDADFEFNDLNKQDSLNELAPGGEFGGGPSYFLTIARAWYYHDLSELGKIAKSGKSPMKHIMDAQLAVEKMLDKGILAPDGVKRRYIIDYNSNFDGVIIISDDYWEHSDYADNGKVIDSRTGEPWSQYDHMEFNDDQLRSGMLEEGLVMGPDDLVDVFLMGKNKRGDTIKRLIKADVPNRKVPQLINFLDSRGYNKNAIVYGPSTRLTSTTNEDYLEEK